MTDNGPRPPETADAVLPDLSEEALLDVLGSNLRSTEKNALAISMRSVVQCANDRTENYAAFGNTP